MARRTMAFLLAGLGGLSSCTTISGLDELEYNRGSGGSGGSGGGGSGGSGGGGSGAYEISCGPGNRAVGIYGRNGSVLDQLGVYCAQLNADGTLGAALPSIDHAGGDGGTPFEKVLCDPGQVVVGIYGEANTFVNKIGIECQTVSDWKLSGMVAGRVDAPSTDDSGQSFATHCPKGEVIYRITGHSAAYVISVLGGCTPT